MVYSIVPALSAIYNPVPEAANEAVSKRLIDVPPATPLCAKLIPFEALVSKPAILGILNPFTVVVNELSKLKFEATPSANEDDIELKELLIA